MVLIDGMPRRKRLISGMMRRHPVGLALLRRAKLSP
jgi:hypothetical protein